MIALPSTNSVSSTVRVTSVPVTMPRHASVDIGRVIRRVDILAMAGICEAAYLSSTKEQ